MTAFQVFFLVFAVLFGFWLVKAIVTLFAVTISYVAIKFVKVENESLMDLIHESDKAVATTALRTTFFGALIGTSLLAAAEYFLLNMAGVL